MLIVAQGFVRTAGIENRQLVYAAKDFLQLAGAWYTEDEASDIDGSGLVDIEDYFLLASHWYWEGDEE